MATKRDIRMRIKSINETKQITKAMKLISAAKLKKAKQMLDATLPFFKKIQTTMEFILHHTDAKQHIDYFEKPVEYAKTDDYGFAVPTELTAQVKKKVGYIIITADKTLSGSYNSTIVKLAEKVLQENSQNELKLFVVGNLGRIYFRKKGYNVDEDFFYATQNPTYYRAREIADILLDLYHKKELDEIYLIYTMAVTALKLEPKVMKLLPLQESNFEESPEDFEESKYLLEFNFEPSPKVVFNRLVPQYLKGIIYGALVESFTSEQSARMNAMDSATRNAEELIKKLTLYYNRARQAGITQEISEVVGGAEAIKS